MGEANPTTASVSAATAETILCTIQGSGSAGAQNIDNPALTGAISNQIVRGVYAFTWGATTTTLTLRCRRAGLGGAGILGPGGGTSIVKLGPLAASQDAIPFTFYDANAPSGQVYVVTGLAAVVAVTAGAILATVNDCS